MEQQQKQKQLHIFFFPMMARGHMIPTLDMAKLFSSTTSAAVKSTIITTPLNASAFSTSIRSSQLDLQILEFPSAAAGLPEGVENVDHCTSHEMVISFFMATALLQEPLERLLGELRPDCLVADMFFPWATCAASRFGIPRLVFHGTSFFALCASASMRMYKPFKDVESDSEPFVLPNLPHEIKLLRTQIARNEREETNDDFTELLNQVKDSDLESYGVIMNSFLELEPDYVNHYRNVLKRRAWHIGPLSLCNKDIEDKVRGKKAAIDEHECLKWLDSQKLNSVIYVCFGSVADISAAQLYEIAMGLEASDQPFIWVVRRSRNEGEDNMWLPNGFEERTKGWGLIIRGWAPQVLILDHRAVGGFMTHCGWNSTLEGVCAGVPMVTWPVFAEQFYNEKLVTEVLRIGVSVGVKEWNRMSCEGIRREVVEKSVKKILVEEEGKEMRRRAKELKVKAKQAIEEGGSSYNDLSALIEELSSLDMRSRELK
ncbi:hypothetical protein LguiB_021375 [Lonicera macranthoides]